jgi:hypothetical protein
MQNQISQYTRKLRIIAQDPSVRLEGKILTADVEIPSEELAPGPCGYRVHVIDYDASTNTLYRPRHYPPLKPKQPNDPYRGAPDKKLLQDPNYHAQNVYAIVMRTLARFEFALGRRVSWSFYGHQLKVAPHAFADANAFYSKEEHGLFFGYFPGREGQVFTCLSHDIVVHETVHALLDGLRSRYLYPSSPDQAAFHEGFADIVALLSVFSLPEVVRAALELKGKGKQPGRIHRSGLTVEALRKSILFGLAEEMGTELSQVRGSVLRNSTELKPSTRYLEPTNEEFREPHRRGEVLVAAVMNAFLKVWAGRLSRFTEVTENYLDYERVVEEGSAIADYLLTMMIRALDYTPPVDLEFGDFLSAVLTSDHELNTHDSKYNFRKLLLESFLSYGIRPTSKGTATVPGIWEKPESDLNYGCTHFESMQRDPDEVFRFIWENRRALKLYEQAYSQVISVRPCLRIGPDGFALRETVAEYTQTLALEARQLALLKIKAPKGLSPTFKVWLNGGGALIFDEYGHLKFHVRNRLDTQTRQTRRLKYLWETGALGQPTKAFSNFAGMHRQRALFTPQYPLEEW